MDASRWEQVKDLFTEIGGLPEETRQARLQAADGDLRAEVLSLVANSESPYFDRSAIEHAVDLMKEAEFPELVGPWRLLRELGHGGMATVYLAERADGQFEKQVAVKILRAGIYGDDMRRRFLRERQLLAALDHPNIIRLIDGNVLEDGRPYIIEDYVDGQPITHYARSRNLDAKARVSLLAEVARAIAYAHEKGVVHRDLKPGNILVNAEGSTKLIDFGVARLLDPDNGASGETQSHYWTPGYASPEQIQGIGGGPPSDVYSLGLILYELLTDRRAFPAEKRSAYEAVRKAVENLPDLNEAPLPVRDLLARCLAVDAAHRPGAADLSDRLSRIDWGMRWSPKPTRRAVLAASGGLSTAGAAAWIYRRDTQPRFRELPGKPESNAFPSFSPDGEEIVYRNQDRGPMRLMVWNRRTGGTRRLLEGGDHGLFPSLPRWSPDGKWVAFRNTTAKGGFEVHLIAAAGGAPRRVAQQVDVSIAWSPDSRSVLVSRRASGQPLALVRVPLDGGAEVRITSPPPGAWGDLWMAPSLDGRFLAVVRYVTPGDGDLYLFEPYGKLIRRLTQWHCWFNGIAFHPNGSEVLFAAMVGGKDSLWRVSTRGDSQPVSVSTPPGTTPRLPAWAPTGQVAFTSDNKRITTYRGLIAEGRVRAKAFLAAPGDEPEYAVFRPDGRALAWTGLRGGVRCIWLANRDGSGIRRAGPVLSEPARDLSWSPDMRYLAFTQRYLGRLAVQILDVQTGEIRPLNEGDSNEGRASWSADGRWIYFRSDHDGAQRFHRMAWPDGRTTEPITTVAVDGAEAPGGRSFLYLPNDQSPFMEVSLEGGPPRQMEGVPPLRIGFWSVVAGCVVYLDDFQGNGSPVCIFDFARRTSRLLAGVPEYRGNLLPPVAVSPDLKEVLWGSWSSRSAIWIADGVA